jgi:uncharacterized protein YhbP (UPF0306 family)
MDVRNLIDKYLEDTQMMQVITTRGDQGWGTTVYFAYDNDLNLYWISRPERRHSQEIESNPKVGGVIVKFHTYGEKVRGLQLEGIAERLQGEEAERGLAVYSSRYSIPRARVLNISGGLNGERHIVYRVKPTLFVLYDEVNFPDDPRQELRI